jgi:hypothetical protein
VDELARDVIAEAAALPGAQLGEGAFAPGQAVWVGKREVAHVDRDGALEIRLTRSAIRAQRDELRAEARVTLNANSDWLAMRVASDADVDDAITLIAEAIAANVSTARPGPPPTGAELARRRRFH